MFPKSAFFIVLEHILFLFIIFICYVSSNKLLHSQSIQSVPWKRAITDNLCHITIGFFSWLIVISIEDPHRQWPIISCILCGLFAGVLDIDHFIMAKSINLNDALNLPSRPPFHNTTLILFSVTSVLLITYYIHLKKIEYITWILLVAAISHHLRDALHRGLWLWPISLKPFPQIYCVVFTYMFCAFIGFLKNVLHKPIVLEEHSIV